MDPESFFMSFFEKEKDDKANVYLKVASSIIILIFGVIFGLMPYFMYIFIFIILLEKPVVPVQNFLV